MKNQETEVFGIDTTIGPATIYYIHEEPNSHFWASLEHLDDYLSVSSFKERDPNKVLDFIKIGIKNTQNQGYYLKKSLPEPGPETNPLLIDMKETFNKCFELVKKKNADYSGKETQDPFANFKKCEVIGVSPEQGVMVRMMDKMSRISNLLKQDAEVKTEAIEDTLEDLINYAAILKSYIKNNKK